MAPRIATGGGTPLNPLKHKLAAGQPVMGTWNIVSSPQVVEIGIGAGMDFAILDMEHGVWDWGTLESGVRACEAAGGQALVRVPALLGPAIQSALDIGAAGLIVPQVRGVEDCREVVALSTLPPNGRRGYNPFTRAAGYSPKTPSGRLEPEYLLRGVIVESIASFAELDGILAIPEIDLLYFGVYDLSMSAGCAGDVQNPRVVEMVHQGVSRTRAAGKAAGLMVSSREQIDRALTLGANFLVYSVDTALIQGAFASGTAALKEAGASLKA